MEMDIRLNIMEFKDIKKNNRQRGNITLEATIFLILFISFYLVMLDLMQLARAQVILQYCATETAKEISQCSYALTKSGIIAKRLETSAKAQKLEADVKEFKDDLEKVQTALGGLDIDGAYNSANSAYNGAMNLISNPDETFNSIIALIKDKGAEIVSDEVIRLLVESIYKKQVEGMTTKNPSIYLENMGVKDGLEGLNFSASRYANNASAGMPELEVVVSYSMEPQIGIFKLTERKYCVCAKTALW